MELRELKEARQKGAVLPFLENFIRDSAAKTDFADVDYFVRQELVSLIEEESSKEEWDSSFSRVIANVLRLISRDEKNVDVLFSSDVKNYVLSLAKLPEDLNHFVDIQVQLEAVKCLVNSLYKSQEMRNFFGRSSHEALRDQLKVLAGKTAFEAEEGQKYHFLLRILFISTALQENMRELWTEDAFFNVLLTILEQNLSLAMIGNQSVLEDLKTRVSEILKTFFNLFCKAPQDLPEKTTAILQIVKKILFSKLAGDAECCQNCVNLIFTLPVALSVICPPVKDVKNVSVQYEGRDMSVMKILLNKMEQRIDQKETEMLTMYLTAIYSYCVACPEARRYVRLLILPPLKDIDVKRQPDEGNSLRNKLVRIMKSVGNAGTVASELMFVLCKRSVARMIKYTGFGHSAGLLANAGLLGQVNLPKSSDDSEDSETEEYAAVEGQVNPVTGCIRPPNHPNPLEGMSEEQKEYEAVKLMNQLNEMLESGIVKPATIGEDGKARPVSHVLELAKNLPEGNHENSDSE